MTIKSLILAVTAAISISLSSFATPAMAFGGNRFDACNEPQVLDFIQNRFKWTEAKLIKRGLAIDAIVGPQRSRVTYGTEYWSIPRLYCQATAHMNDGEKRAIWWLIEGGMGFAGLSDNLEFCIAGLDPLKVHGAWCRSVR